MSDYFSNVSKIEFEGPDSDNPLAFRHYNPEEIVAGKSTVSYTHLTLPTILRV